MINKINKINKITAAKQKFRFLLEMLYLHNIIQSYVLSRIQHKNKNRFYLPRRFNLKAKVQN